MKLTHYWVAINNTPFVAREIYSYQIAQSYRDNMQVMNAKKVNEMRGNTVVEIPKVGVENVLFKTDKTPENFRVDMKKNEDLKKTYEIYRKPVMRKNNEENKGFNIDINI